MSLEPPQTPTDPPALAPAAHTSPELINPERWLEEHGDALFGFALLRVRERSVAQDLWLTPG